MNDMSKVSGLALDIDDTLAWTCREWAEILHEEFGNPENLTKHEFVEKYRLLENAPYFQREDVLTRCREICMADRYYHALPPIEDALSAVREIQQVIPIVAYLTARPESLRKTTEEWLSRNNFPTAPLMMNPHEFSHSITATWKSETLEKLHPQIVGIIDDNPKVCAALSDGYRGIVFLYGHGDADVPHSRAIACSDWNNVVEKVRNYYAARIV